MKRRLLKGWELDWGGVGLVVVLVFAIVSLELIVATTYRHRYEPGNHLVLLAQRMTQGKLSLDAGNHPSGDVVDYFANIYLYFGPLAAMVLIPIVWVLGSGTPQIMVGLGSLVAVFVGVFVMARRKGYADEDCGWWAVFFCFSTVMLGVSVLDLSAYQVQALGAVWVVWALVEYYGKRRWWLMGSLVGLAGLTRLVLVGSVVFLGWEGMRLKISRRKWVELIVPVVAAMALLGAYNWRRFGSILETGYKYNVTLATYPMVVNFGYGMFSWKHVATNLYAMFLIGPEPVLEPGGGLVLRFPYLKVNPWGLAIWISSPLLLMLGKLKRKKEVVGVMVAVVVLALPVLAYFGVGFSQFGYRYALDFWPFLLLLLMAALKPKLSGVAKGLIVLGVVFNCFYLASIWGIYPHVFMETNVAGEVVTGWQWWRGLQ